MTPDRWEQVKETFDAALKIGPDQRHAFLNEVCAEDADLRAAVESLLAAHNTPTDFLEPPIEGAVVALVAEATRTLPIGERVGPYRLIDVIASGGMGTVYRAVRADGAFDRDVALKVIKRGMATDDILHRFRRERQTLANLTHPNIARLLDGGATDQPPKGEPYLVMELVEGKPIDRYCDEQRISVAGRLELFGKVCSAVHYAHQNLIVHRDLKPNNILIAEDGTPKLLDFGISKLLSDEGGVQTTDPTATGRRLLTPQYASPEQIRGEPVTTASDVYSLGVILYELLTGHQPYEINDRPKHELERIICESNPKTPSTAISLTVEITDPAGTTRKLTPDSVGEARNTNPDKLRRRLRGDLDTIVMTAMHKDPARRYSSVEQLADDIRRHLDGLPVRAQRDTLGYRSRKFIRRNKVVVIAAVLVFLSLSGGVIGTTIGLVQARAAQEVAEDQAEKARIEAAKADRINEFLQDMLASFDPSHEENLTRAITVQEVLDDAARRLENEFSDFPVIRADLEGVIGHAYMGLGLFDDAALHLRAALDISVAVHGRANNKSIDAMRVLGEALVRKADYAEARVLLNDALSAYQGTAAEENAGLAKCWYNLATLDTRTGDYPTAESAARRALALVRELHDERHPLVLQSMSQLASILFELASYADAEEIYQRVSALERERVGGTSVVLADSLNGLGRVLNRVGDYRRAEQAYSEALAVYKEILGEKHPSFRSTLHNIARMHTEIGDYDQALTTMREVVRIKRETLATTDPSLAASLNQLGIILHRTGKDEEAERAYREVLNIQRKVVGHEHPHVGVTLSNLALVLETLEDLAGAEECHRESLDILAKALGNEHPNVATARSHLGQLLHRTGRLAEAEVYQRAALAICRKTLPPDHISTAVSLTKLASVLLDKGAADEAERLLREALPIWRGTQHLWHTAHADSLLGGALVSLDRFREAESMLCDSYTVLKAKRGPEDEKTLKALLRILRLYEAWDKPEEAAKYRALLPEATTPEMPEDPGDQTQLDELSGAGETDDSAEPDESGRSHATDEPHDPADPAVPADIDTTDESAAL